MAEFTHLHVHSHYSLLDGLGKLPDLLSRAQELGMKHLALTDHGALYGLIEFSKMAGECGIHPLLGIEAYLAPEGRLKRAKDGDKPRHLTLLASNLQGYKNLLVLSTVSHLEGFYYKPRMDYDLLRKHAEGIIALSGCLNGDIPQAIIAGDKERVEELLTQHIDIFGKERFFLELQHHPSLPEQQKVNDALVRYARKYGLPLVATGDVHYVHEHDAEAQDVLLCVQTGSVVTDTDRMCMLGENYSLHSPEQMATAFRDIPEAIENTMRIAEMCAVALPLGGTVLPTFSVPDGHTPDTYLRQLCAAGLERRFPGEVPEAVKTRLSYELSVIEQTGFTSYLLIVQDFVNWAKRHDILVGPGRGSAAGSIVSYLLNITNMDPVKYDLMFERFLNPFRISMPDIDLDFADDRRDDVIQYVRERYGSDRVAQIITFGTMAARAAVRDTGRALGFPYAFCDKIAKLLPFHTSLQEAVDGVKELRELYVADPQVRRLVDTAKKLEGGARHASTHAAGVVITDKPLVEYVPLQRATQDDTTIITQYAMNDIEALGLLKIDFLGLKNLTILHMALRMIRERYGVTLDLDAFPLADAATYATIQRGSTTGVFQLESEGMKRYLKELQPTEFEDIVAMVALYRPGPMELIPDYIAGKHGLKQPHYLHPILEPILEKTYGIAVYQEQVLRIAQDLAGFSLGEADVLRKAVGKKIPKLLAEQKVKFVAGTVKNGVDEATAERVFQFIEPFAGYGFNRAHAACYALIAYQTAYLKTHYPAAFMAALLTSDEDDTDRIAIEVAESESMGISILPPDVNESNEGFTVVGTLNEVPENRGESIRFGLRAIKNVGRNIVAAILQARRDGGPYTDLADFFSRVRTRDLNRKSLESLIKTGAFDSLGERNLLLENSEMLLAFSRDAAKRAAGIHQTDLFAGLEGTSARAKLHLAPAPPASERQKLNWEKELLGLFVSGHPLAAVSELLASTTLPLGSVSVELADTPVRVGGIITKVQRIVTRNQKTMAFVTLEDRTGSAEVLVFPNILEATAEMWTEDRLIIVEGRVSDKDGVAKVIAETAAELDPHAPPSSLPETGGQPRQHPPAKVLVRVPERAPKRVFLELKSIFESVRAGSTAVFLHIPRSGGAVDVVKTSYRVAYSPFLHSRVEALLGPGSVSAEDAVGTTHDTIPLSAENLAQH